MSIAQELELADVDDVKEHNGGRESTYSQELKQIDNAQVGNNCHNYQNNGETSSLLSSSTQQNGEKMRILVNPHTNQ